MSDENRKTLKEVSHTHPYTGETFGDVYRRGPAVTDGGPTEESGSEQLRDVDHTPPHGDSANEVWSRGHEGAADETDEDDGDEDVGVRR